MAGLAGAVVWLSLATAALAGSAPPSETPADPPREPIREFREPSGAITLEEALAAALLGNPTLAVSSWEIRVREAEGLQAGLLPNPELNVSVEDVGLGKRSPFASPNQTSVTLSQLVELGGKRAARIRLAGSEHDLARWDYEARRASVLAETTKRFVAVLVATKRLALVEELVETAEKSARSVEAAVGAGAISAFEEQRARLAASRARLDRAQIKSDLEVSRLALAASWGSGRALFSAPVGDLETVTEPQPLEAAAIAKNPDLARWGAEIASREATIALEKTARIPSFTLGAGMRRFHDGRGAVLFEGSVPLPIFNRNEGAIRAAETRLARARAEKKASQVALVAALGEIHQGLLAAYGQVHALRREILPQTQAAYEASLDGSRMGLFRAIEVVDARRALFDVRSQYLQALAAYHTAAVEVERLTGAPFAAPLPPHE